jgi:hypothetical protein
VHVYCPAGQRKPRYVPSGTGELLAEMACERIR